MSIWLLGLDLGQSNDYTALVIVEARGTMRTATWEGEMFGFPKPEQLTVEMLPISGLDVRHIERFPLHTPYQEIALKVGDRMRAIPMPRSLIIDRTGVGVGIAEMLGYLQPIGATITAGGNATMTGPNLVNVPKRDLVAGLQVALQNRTLHIAKKLPNATLLQNELTNFRAKVSAGGHDTYESWREADHDDLVLAAALAVWWATECFRLRAAQVQEFRNQRRVEQLMRQSRISLF